MKSTRITIIGFGNVGKALCSQFVDNDFEVISVFNRSNIHAEYSKKFPQIAFHTGLPDSSQLMANHLFLTVSDDALETVIDKLNESIDDFSGKFIYHCSGTHASSMMQPLRESGAKIASFHPMKAVTQESASFADTWFDVEGDQQAIDKLSEIANAFNAKIFQIKPESKPYLHAAAVVASNYLVVLTDIVSRISQAGGIEEEEALQSIIPLMHNTLNNVNELGPAQALTGPIRRGDVNTVKYHLKILNNSPDLISLYKVLGLETIRMAERNHSDYRALEEIEALLS